MNDIGGAGRRPEGESLDEENGHAARRPIDILEAIDRTWFGAALSPETQARLATLARPIELAPGTTLLHEGETTDSLSIVLAGRVSLSMHVPERGAVEILTVEPGDIVGWSALVPPHRATSECVAVDRVELLSFNGAELRAALRADHALAASVYPRILQVVSRRLAATRFQLLDLFATDHPAAERPSR
jgi:CRP/FNR family cyclic AMP-dependent transcriptional regulator